MNIRNITLAACLSLGTGCIAEYGETPSAETARPDSPDDHSHSENYPDTCLSIAQANNKQIQAALDHNDPNTSITAHIFDELMPQYQYEALTYKFGDTHSSQFTICQGGYTNNQNTFRVTCLNADNRTRQFSNLGVTTLDLESEKIIYQFQSASNTITEECEVPTTSNIGRLTFDLFNRVF